MVQDGSVLVGFIPAGAGAVHRWQESDDQIQVHPRWRGVYPSVVVFFVFLLAVPPPVRGSGCFPFSLPASAGFWSFRLPPLAWTKVHSRLGGVCNFSPLPPHSHHGSSLRLRGLLGGSIPRRARCVVHPRACGVCFQLLREAYDLRGSSPQLRGLHIGCQLGLVQVRFIPAPARGSANVDTVGANRSRFIPALAGSARSGDYRP